MLRDLRVAVVILMLLCIGAGLFFGRPMLVIGGARDPQGQPVTDVEVRSKGWAHTPGGLNAAFALGDASFAALCLFCPELRLWVSAVKREAEVIYLSSEQVAQVGDRVEVDSSLFGLLQRVRVTLYPVQQVDASHLRAALLFEDGAPRRVASVDPGFYRASSPDQLDRELRRRTRGERRVAPYLSLEADLAPDGLILHRGRPWPPARAGARQRPPRAVPVRARLRLNNVEGGFIPVDPVKGVPEHDAPREILRRLRHAPRNGYVADLDLDFDRAHLGESYFFFYCRVGDRYGKGRLVAPALDQEPPSRLTGDLEIWFNGDGERELPEGD